MSLSGLFPSFPVWGLWAGFTLSVLALILGDLLLLHKKPQEVTPRQACIWSVGWISLGLAFGLGVWAFAGAEKASQYYTGFLLEKSLSVDNIFVFVMIFSFFGIKRQHQHKILFYGILGAIAMRACAILSGAALLAHFHWVIYVFGGFLIATAAKMLLMESHNAGNNENIIIRFVSRLFPVSSECTEEKFFVRKEGRWLATPLFLALFTIELSDVIFAVDSIPAVFAVTNDAFIVYSSNIFAILGLRALYFLSSALIQKFRYLNKGVALTLLFVGMKMLASDFFPLSSLGSLGIVFGILASAVGASLWAEHRELQRTHKQTQEESA